VKKISSTFKSAEIKRKLANPLRQLRTIYFTCFCLFTGVVKIISVVGRTYSLPSLCVLLYSEHSYYLLTASELNYFRQENGINNNNNNKKKKNLKYKGLCTIEIQ
jgi:hypothetical protein